MKIIAALALASPNLVIHYFEVLQKDCLPELLPLFDYFKDNYLGNGNDVTQRF